MLACETRSGTADPDSRDLRHDLLTPLTVIAAQTQLLQRRLRRADGLSTLERDLLLGNVANTLVAVQQLTAQLERMLSGRPASVPEESAGADCPPQAHRSRARAR
jgi:signal transduction histidine kinase